MALSLLLACLFPFLGVAAQSTGLYVFAILVPAIVLFRRQAVPSHTGEILLKLGAAVLFVWALFPLANLLALTSSVPEIIASSYQREMPTKGVRALLTSRLSSAWAISGVCLLLTGIAARAREARREDVEDVHARVAPRAFVWFLRALLMCAAVWVCFLTYQAITGFEPRNVSRLALPEHRMANGLYRSFGFYGHPLSVAGTGLTLLSFFWFLFWARLEEKSAAQESLSGNSLREGAVEAPLALFPKSGMWTAEICYFAGTLAGVIAVAESGGRTAMAATVVLCGVIPFLVRLRGSFWKLRVVGAVSAVGVALLALAGSGMLGRIEEVLRNQQSGQGENRYVFWKTYLRMIADAPWFGQGHYWIEHGLREAYYDTTGFAGLAEKFNAHNLYLETVANIGVIGAMLALGGLWFLHSTLGRLASGAISSQSQLMYRGLRVAVFANLLHAFTQNTFFDSNVLLPCLLLFWTCLWLGVTLAPFSSRNEPLRKNATAV